MIADERHELHGLDVDLMKARRLVGHIDEGAMAHVIQAAARAVAGRLPPVDADIDRADDVAG
jgi:hypothetical protein